MGVFDQAKDMYKLQKQAKQLKKELKNIHVEAEHEGVTVTVNGEQNVISVKIAEGLAGDLPKIEAATTEAINKAIKKSQEVGAQKMQEMMGGLGGLFGGAQ